jgi:hypothetical protein
MAWVENVVRMKAKCTEVFIGKPEGKRPLGKLRCRQEDIIQMDLTEI